MTQQRRLGLTVCVAGLFALSMLGSALPHSGAWSYFASRHVAVLGLGVLCALLHRSIARRVSLPVVPAFLAVAALFALAWANSKSEGDWPTIVCAIGIVVVASLARGFREGSAFARLWGTLARASYSIYLSQAFSLAGFAYAADRLGLFVTLPFWVAIVLTMVVGLACGVACHRGVEEPMQRALRFGLERLRGTAFGSVSRNQA
jgi:peptidoglycan/LPS O-acetylase OafA/YrhL